jgi:ribonuclease HII
MIVGVDEAGRGPLAGPVVSCALYLKKQPPFSVKDSKRTLYFVREEIFSWLIKNTIFSVGYATAQEIDRFNILEATFLSFRRAIDNLLRKDGRFRKATFIIDGNIFRTNLKLKYVCIKKADEKIKEVSCASIVAKVMRDYLMDVLHFLYPQWNFSQHKGYPTKEHIHLLKKYSFSPFHRKSFSPRQLIIAT